jgi:DNA-binding transcriptional ArsR family regulator
MSEGPNIAKIAALIGDPARAEILTALMNGKALTATELARVAGITKQTASSHLAKLTDAQLISQTHQGRHKYFQLADLDVAGLLESMMGVAYRAGSLRLVPGPRDPALRLARVCYDHLAGDLGVKLLDSLVEKRVLRSSNDSYEVAESGWSFFEHLGITSESVGHSKRPICRPCLDWSERRHHLGGALGARLLESFFSSGWARRIEDTRVVQFTQGGEVAFRTLFSIST